MRNFPDLMTKAAAAVVGKLFRRMAPRTRNLGKKAWGWGKDQVKDQVNDQVQDALQNQVEGWVGSNAPQQQQGMASSYPAPAMQQQQRMPMGQSGYAPQQRNATSYAHPLMQQQRMPMSYSAQAPQQRPVMAYAPPAQQQQRQSPLSSPQAQWQQPRARV